MLANKWVMGILAIAAGILVIVLPQIIAYIIGVFLIVSGFLIIFLKK